MHSGFQNRLTAVVFHVFILASLAPVRLNSGMNPLDSTTSEAEISERRGKPEDSESPQLCDLVPFVAGNRIFAVFAEHVDGTAEAKPVAPLPHAPAAVVGVVCVRGRMLTVLDPIALCTGETATWAKILPSVVALRGDEQLALAAQTCRPTITIAVSDIETQEPEGERSGNASFGLVRHAGEEITVLNVDKLFVSAIQRRERRRRRF